MASTKVRTRRISWLSIVTKNDKEFRKPQDIYFFNGGRRFVDRQSLYNTIGQNTNLFSADSSEDFSDADWVKENTTVSVDQIAAPPLYKNPGVTADKIVETATDTTHIIRQSQVITVAQHTFSVFLKAGGRTEAYLLLYNATDNNVADAYFDLENGIVTSTPFGSSAIASLGDGWYRCSVTGTPTIAAHICYIYPAMGPAGTSLTYVGNVSKGIYAWGAMIEQAAAPGPYQKV